MGEEGPTSIKSEFLYTLELNEEIDLSLKDMTSEDVNKMVQKENAKNLALQKEREDCDGPLDLKKVKNNVLEGNRLENHIKSEPTDSAYVYVLESENGGKMETDSGFDEKDQGNTQNGDIHNESDDFEPKLVIDLSMGSVKCNSGVSPAEAKCNGAVSPTELKSSSEIVHSLSTSGANKRKRKSNMQSVLSSIMRNKSINDSNRDVDNSLNADGDESQSSVESNVVEQPAKRHITEKFVTDNSFNRQSLSPALHIATPNSQDSLKIKREPTSENGLDMVLNLSKGSNDTVLNLTKEAVSMSTPNSDMLTSKPLNLVTSTPNTNTGGSRKNRRKTYVPIKCEKVDMNDVNQYVEEYSGERLTGTKNTNDFAPLNLTPRSEKTGFAPIDLTPASCIKKEPVTPSTFGKTLNKILTCPVDLSARNSPVNMAKNSPVNMTRRSSPLTTARKSPVNTTTASVSINGVPVTAADTKPVNFGMPMVGQPGMFPGGFRPNLHPLMAGMNPTQMKDFLDLMVKLQSNFPNQNMLQANAQLMQFHALMQNAMLNNSLMAMGGHHMNKNGGKVKSDKNDNIVKSEPVIDKPEAIAPENISKFNLDFMQKNGMMPQNNFMSGFNGFPGAIPSMPFMPNQMLLKQKGTPGRRRRNKESLGGSDTPNRTTIPKLEDIPILRTHVDSSNPELIVETLKKLFPQQQSKNNSTVIDYNTNGGSNTQFFVKDNEQIQSIVDSLLLVCEIEASEGDHLSREQGYKNICRLCDATFFHIEHLTKHIKKVHVVKRFQCNQCERSFHDAGNYRQHMRVHDESDIPYECQECNRRFRHKCTLKVHLRIHTGEKPFKCEICGATFKISSGLQTHMRKHTGETPYACEHCSMRFKCQSNLKQHLFQHTQARPFSCDICQKSYSRKSIRDAHMLTHGKEFAMGKLDISQIPELSPVASDIPLVGSPEMPSLSTSEVHTGQSVFAGQ